MGYTHKATGYRLPFIAQKDVLIDAISLLEGRYYKLFTFKTIEEFKEKVAKNRNALDAMKKHVEDHIENLEEIAKKKGKEKFQKQQDKKKIKLKFKAWGNDDAPIEVDGINVTKHFGLYQPNPNKKLYILVHKNTGFSLFPDLPLRKATKIAKYIEDNHGRHFDFKHEKDFDMDNNRDIIQDIMDFKKSL